MRRPLWAWLVALAGVAAATALSVRYGSVDLAAGDVWRALLPAAPGDDDVVRHIVRDFRLPRALLGLFVGGGLAAAGATFQALLRNPLAEPYILGVSGGAAAAAVGALTFGLGSFGIWVLPLSAFGGAVLAIALVFAVAAAADRGLDVRVLLLAGVVVGAFFTAIVALLLSISEADTVRSAVLWMMGSLYGADWRTVAVVALYTLPATAVMVGLARPLDLIATGEETAAYLGVDVERAKWIGFGVGSLVTAAGVAAAGVIGFVGLVVPHAVRLTVGAGHRALIPLSFLVGGVFLTLADLVARVVLAPTEIPIGVVTALVGVPIFLVLLRRSLAA